MTKIEKAVRTVSDLYDFYRRIPKISSEREKGGRRERARLAGRGRRA
jgi:hypothetical protein